jgi:hypothetical protein
MEKLLKINDPQSQYLSSLLEADQKRIKTDIKDLQLQIENLENQFKANENLLNDINGKQNGNYKTAEIFTDDVTTYIANVKSRLNGYKTEWNYWEKINYFFNVELRALSGIELIDLLLNYEPELKSADKNTLNKAKANIWAMLSNKAKFGQLGRFKDGKDYRYGRINWFNKDGSIKKEFAL